MSENLIELLKRTDSRLSSSDAARLLSVIGRKVGTLEKQVVNRDNVILELRADNLRLSTGVAGLQQELASAQQSAMQSAQAYQDLGEKCFEETEKLQRELGDLKAEVVRCQSWFSHLEDEARTKNQELDQAKAREKKLVEVLTTISTLDPMSNLRTAKVMAKAAISREGGHHAW